ncbi:DMT family transporter [Sphaerisporangium sp. B11E5]|uniref:DMT family transporter n=1 Tax=Sphaerisporangium sp. B11E5 TaxID=3153563 RepID=UPI00325D0C60
MRQSTGRSGAAGMAAGAMFLVGTLTAVSGLIGDYPVYGGQAVRYLAAATVLLLVARLTGLRFPRLTVREASLLAALSLTGVVLFNVSVIEATRHAGPGLVGTVLGAAPLVLALLSGRRPDPRTLAGAAVVVAGAVLATGLGTGNLPGLLWSLAALAFEVCYSLLALPLLPRLGAVRVAAYATVIAVPILTVIGLTADGTAFLRVPTTEETLGLGYLALVVTTVAFYLWYTALPRLGPGVAGLFAGLIPVGAIVTGMVLGLAIPSPADLLGAGLVIAGIAIGVRGGRPRPARRAPRGRELSESGTL